MKSEAFVMTLDLGTNHFNAILLNKQLKLIAGNGSLITVPGDNRMTLAEQTRLVLQVAAHCFKFKR